MEDTATDVLHRLRALGVRVAIDDFGTGHSSLSYLKRLPVDQLKIDRSFVSEVGCSAEDAAIVAAVIAEDAAISADVVAEGVEVVGQADTLAGLGCAVAQGFLWVTRCPRPPHRRAAPPPVFRAGPRRVSPGDVVPVPARRLTCAVGTTGAGRGEGER